MCTKYDNVSNPSKQVTGYLNGTKGYLFGIETFRSDIEPEHGLTNLVYIVGPLFEELNCSRSFLANFRHAISGLGWSAVQYDLYGSGDSGGDLEDADMCVWQSDLLSTLKFHKAQGFEKIHLVTLRAGSLLLAGIEASVLEQVDSMLLIEPVCNGEQHIESLARLSVASRLLTATTGDSIRCLQEKLRSRRAMELSGYILSTGLVKTMASSVVDTKLLSRNPAVVSVNLTSSAMQKRSQNGAKHEYYLDTVQNERLASPAFWQRHETRFEHRTIEELLALLLSISNSG